MRSIPPVALLAMTFVGCGSAPPPERVIFPHEAAPIESVCSPDSAQGVLAVTAIAPFKNNGVRRLRVVNVSGSPREIHPGFVSQDVGSCDGPFARSMKLSLEDAGSCAPPGSMVLGPGESLELRLQPQPLRVSDACTKIGLAFHGDVDGQEVCVDLGAWIAYRPGGADDDLK